MLAELFVDLLAGELRGDRVDSEREARTANVLTPAGRVAVLRVFALTRAGVDVYVEDQRDTG